MPRLCHAILYDADEKGRETLAYGFEIDGLKITACSRVDEFERALTSTPAEAVVVVLRDEDEHAIPLLRGLAESPQHGQRPRLVLAEAPTLPASVVEMNLPGPSGFLPLPAFVRDVVTAAKLLAGGATRDEESSLEGALSDFGLFFILRTMVALGLSGVVEVDRSNRKGELRFHEGEVVSAQVGPHDGLAALHQLLLWEEAALVIRFRATVRRGQEFPKGDELLDDCARFLRDFEHATRSIGHAQSLFVQDAEKTASLLDEVTAELVPILRLFDGHRNLGDVLEDSPYRAFDTLRTVARLIELKTIRRKAIEKPTTGLAPGKRPRPAQEDWLGRSGEAAAMGAGGPGSNVGDVRNVGSAGDFGPSAPRPARVEARSTPAGGAPVAGMRGHRSFRRKTGEHAIAPAPTPDQPAGTPGGMTSGTPSEPSGPPPANVVRTASIPTLPLPAVPNTPPPVAAPAPAPVATVAPPAPVPAPAPAAPIPPPAATMPPAVAAAVAPPAVDRPSAVAPTPASRRADAAAAAQIHGELSAGPSERFNRRVLPDVPTMLIDLGPDLSSQAEETEEETPARPPQPAVAATVVVPVAAPVPVPAQVAPPPSIAVATPVEPPPPARRLDVHAAEIDTGMRPQPPAALLEAPPGGPSIMIDPRLVAEMDAFELENTAATPPPALTGQPPQAGQRPVAGTMSSPSAGAVVSFVRGGPARPGGAGFNAAPTIEVAPQATAPAAPAPASAAPSAPMPVPASAPTSASAPAPAPASVPAPVSVPAPASPSAPGAGAAVPAPAVSGEIAGARHTPGTRPVPHDRRASGEFDALEAEFFAREKDLYGKEEPVENFDDLDPNHQGNKGNKGKTS